MASDDERAEIVNNEAAGQYEAHLGDIVARAVYLREGNRITFPSIPELPAGGTAMMTLDVEGAKIGTARVRAEAKATYLSQPLREEQASRVVAR